MEACALTLDLSSRCAPFLLESGYSLAQPHLERTRLCELADSELDPKYVRQRDGLKTLVQVGHPRP
jgi:hypothetical protein